MYERQLREQYQREIDVDTQYLNSQKLELNEYEKEMQARFLKMSNEHKAAMDNRQRAFMAREREMQAEMQSMEDGFMEKDRLREQQVVEYREQLDASYKKRVEQLQNVHRSMTDEKAAFEKQIREQYQAEFQLDAGMIAEKKKQLLEQEKEQQEHFKRLVQQHTAQLEKESKLRVAQSQKDLKELAQDDLAKIQEVGSFAVPG